MSRSSVKIAAGAVVCSGCELRGDITIGQKTIVHPQARIWADGGPIIIGDCNLIEELSVIHNKVNKDNPNEKVMIIGNYNVFEVGCTSESVKIGDNNILEAKSYVSRDTIVGNGCTIGAMCRVTSSEILPDNCAIYGEECKRRIAGERPPPQTLQLDFLARILPNYHHTKKASSAAIGHQKMPVQKQQ